MVQVRKHKIAQLFIIFGFLTFLFFGYLWIYPNDFFLSDKIFRQAKDYQVKSDFFSYKVYFLPEKTVDLENLIESIDEALKEEAGWFKNNAKRTVSIIQKGQSIFFVKRYNSKSFFDYCSKCPFRSSKAFRSFYYAYFFKQKKLPTPEPIAIVEKRIGFLWTTCYLISKKIEGQSLEELTLETLSGSQSKLIKTQLHHLLNQLYDNKWLHRDLTLGNIFLCKDKLFFLDLDDVHSYAFNNHFFRKKFLTKHQKRLNRSLKHLKTFQETTFFVPEKLKNR